MTNSTSGGIGASGVLAIVFVVLKLTENIDWSWLWVLSPLWIPLLVVIGAVGVVYLFVLFATLLGFRRKRKDPNSVLRW